MPVAQHDAAMTDVRVQRLGGLLGPVLVDEAQPHRGQQDHPDDHRVAALTDEERRAGGDREQDQQRDRSCRPSTGKARARCERTAFGPSVRSRRAASAVVRPAWSLPSLASTPGTASGPAAITPSGAADTGLASPAR